MWRYEIATGRMSHDGVERPERCYSGRGDCKNDPSKCGVVMDGPIPPGHYKIGMGYKNDHLGPYTMNLDPMQDTDTLGRSLFRFHGDSISHPGDASHGCICEIGGHTLREAMNNIPGPRILEVVP